MQQPLNDLIDRIQAEVSNLTPLMVVEALNEFAKRDAEAEELRASQLLNTAKGRYDLNFTDSPPHKAYQLCVNYKRMLSIYSALKILIHRKTKRDYDIPDRVSMAYGEGGIWNNVRKIKFDMMMTFSELLNLYPKVTYRDMNILSLTELVRKYFSSHLAEPQSVYSTFVPKEKSQKAMSGMAHTLLFIDEPVLHDSYTRGGAVYKANPGFSKEYLKKSWLGLAVPEIEHSIVSTLSPEEADAILRQRASKNANILGWSGSGD